MTEEGRRTGVVRGLVVLACGAVLITVFSPGWHDWTWVDDPKAGLTQLVYCGTGATCQVMEFGGSEGDTLYIHGRFIQAAAVVVTALSLALLLHRGPRRAALAASIVLTLTVTGGVVLSRNPKVPSDPTFLVPPQPFGDLYPDRSADRRDVGQAQIAFWIAAALAALGASWVWRAERRAGRLRG